MKVPAVCPACRKQYSLSRHLAGRQVICRNCGGQIDVPPVEIDELGIDPDDVVPRPRSTAGQFVEPEAPPPQTQMGPEDLIPFARRKPIDNTPPAAFPPRQ